jgi:hypothetical protein
LDIGFGVGLKEGIEADVADDGAGFARGKRWATEGKIRENKRESVFMRTSIHSFSVSFFPCG